MSSRPRYLLQDDIGVFRSRVNDKFMIMVMIVYVVVCESNLNCSCSKPKLGTLEGPQGLGPIAEMERGGGMSKYIHVKSIAPY